MYVDYIHHSAYIHIRKCWSLTEILPYEARIELHKTIYSRTEDDMVKHIYIGYLTFQVSTGSRTFRGLSASDPPSCMHL